MATKRTSTLEGLGLKTPKKFRPKKGGLRKYVETLQSEVAQKETFVSAVNLLFKTEKLSPKHGIEIITRIQQALVAQTLEKRIKESPTSEMSLNPDFGRRLGKMVLRNSPDSVDSDSRKAEQNTPRKRKLNDIIDRMLITTKS